MRFAYSTAIAATFLAVAGSAAAQTWSSLKNTPNISAYNAMLLTDGTVFVQDGNNNAWWKLKPDSKGSYLNGTWTQLPSTGNYGPLYYASQVMTDGRVFTMGGEYNFGTILWQNLGFIYDPVANKWTSQPAPSGWSMMGDTGSITLPNGKLLLANPFSNQFALFDPASNSFQVPYGSGKGDNNDEEGLTLLPNGNVLTVDAVTQNSSEIFNTQTARWSSGGTTPQSLVGAGLEIGPQVLRPDGTVICFGGGGHNCIYDSKTGIWSSAPDFPTVGAGQLDCADAPACLLPNGHVLVETSPGLFQSGTVFFDWDGTKFTQMPAPVDAASDTSFLGGFLTLPTGQLLYTNQSPDMQIFTPAGQPDPSWAPTISNYPSTVKVGFSYQIFGTQFNGLSGASAYGDDQQNTTNYPLIRITNNATGHLVYCREFNPSTMAVATGSQPVSTSFFVPGTVELGASTLQVVTNGIPSKSVAITVLPQVQASAVSAFQGILPIGTVASIWQVDGTVFSVQSVHSSIGQYAAIEADYTFDSASINSLGVFASVSAQKNATGFIYAYDWQAKQFVLMGAKPLGLQQTAFSVSALGPFPRFVGPKGLVRIVVRGIVPPRFASGPFRLSADAIQVTSS